MSASTGHRKGHVNFGGEDITTPKDNSITITEIRSGHVQVHLGFLQYHHVYRIAIDVPKRQFFNRPFSFILDAAEKTNPNLNCKILSINEKDDTYEFILEFLPRKERLLKEELTLHFEKDQSLLLELNARVLGPGKGTPLLKNGIKCIGIHSEELSDVSDWQAD